MVLGLLCAASCRMPSIWWRIQVVVRSGLSILGQPGQEALEWVTQQQDALQSMLLEGLISRYLVISLVDWNLCSLSDRVAMRCSEQRRRVKVGVTVEQVQTANELWLVHRNGIYMATIFEKNPVAEHSDWLLCWEDGRIDHHDSFESAQDAVGSQ
jgi:hypothetical protein